MANDLTNSFFRVERDCTFGCDKITLKIDNTLPEWESTQIVDAPAPTYNPETKKYVYDIPIDLSHIPEGVALPKDCNVTAECFDCYKDGIKPLEACVEELKNATDLDTNFVIRPYFNTVTGSIQYYQFDVTAGNPPTSGNITGIPTGGTLVFEFTPDGDVTFTSDGSGEVVVNVDVPPDTDTDLRCEITSVTTACSTTLTQICYDINNAVVGTPTVVATIAKDQVPQVTITACCDASGGAGTEYDRKKLLITRSGAITNTVVERSSDGGSTWSNVETNPTDLNAVYDDNTGEAIYRVTVSDSCGRSDVDTVKAEACCDVPVRLTETLESSQVYFCLPLSVEDAINNPSSQSAFEVGNSSLRLRLNGQTDIEGVVRNQQLIFTIINNSNCDKIYSLEVNAASDQVAERFLGTSVTTTTGRDLYPPRTKAVSQLRLGENSNDDFFDTPFIPVISRYQGLNLTTVGDRFAIDTVNLNNAKSGSSVDYGGNPFIADTTNDIRIDNHWNSVQAVHKINQDVLLQAGETLTLRAELNFYYPLYIDQADFGTPLFYTDGEPIIDQEGNHIWGFIITPYSNNFDIPNTFILSSHPFLSDGLTPKNAGVYGDVQGILERLHASIDARITYIN